MRLSLTLFAALAIGATSVQAQQLPSNPDPNKCYVRCVTPDVYQTETVRVQTRPAYKRLSVVPATYRTVTERVLSKEGYKRYEFVPATFRTETVTYQSQAPAKSMSVQPASFADASERVLIKPEVSKWETTAYEGCESDDPNDCQVLCYRTYEAEYRTVPVQRLANDAGSTSSEVPGSNSTYTKQVVATPAQVREIDVEPQYETITKRVVDQPASVTTQTVEAEYTTITKEVLASKGGLSSYEEIDCELTSYSVLPIQYELGSAAITASSRRVIDDRLLNLLRERPNIRIQLNAHTDSRGSAASNQDLSERRAKSVADYLVSRGINRQRLVTRGYGESQLKNRCADGVNCSEAEHQVNRRTEFRVLNMDM
ncbi:OmpA family protein [Lewinella sp. 4G2]|uniref:OmpA family protein n=1 Tax=Lewinella sp. 4G2 TaxID=1803372 RepID=UPI0007B49905|nr:OmpA family protein [Lewinella sp. 4G2]OAV42733.1 cell envelope biogenesis protein OmpA [Lewinella sp. 4G2]